MKKLMKILPVVLVAVFVMTNVFAVGTNFGDLTQGQSGVSNVTKSAGAAWATVVTIVQILAVAAVVFAGLRYMFASADQKADIKKSMGILAVGAILVFAATTILQFVAKAGQTAIKTD